jgi:hypothetical protein
MISPAEKRDLLGLFYKLFVLINWCPFSSAARLFCFFPPAAVLFYHSADHLCAGRDDLWQPDHLCQHRDDLWMKTEIIWINSRDLTE